ncbi:hypothetical protein OKW41_004367 [Paraburkholderia sp. UCT70]
MRLRTHDFHEHRQQLHQALPLCRRQCEFWLEFDCPTRRVAEMTLCMTLEHIALDTQDGLRASLAPPHAQRQRGRHQRASERPY